MAVELAADALRQGAVGRLRREASDLLGAALADEVSVIRVQALREMRSVATQQQLEMLTRMLKTAPSDERLEVALAIRYRMAAHTSGRTSAGFRDGDRP